MIEKILSLIDKPLADDKDLADERLLYLRNELSNFDNEYLVAFYNILDANSIDMYKELFSDEDYFVIKNHYKDAIIKYSFGCMSYIINSLY